MRNAFAGFLGAPLSFSPFSARPFLTLVLPPGETVVLLLLLSSEAPSAGRGSELAVSTETGFASLLEGLGPDSGS